MIGLAILVQFSPYSTEQYSLIDIIQVSQHHWTSLVCEMSHNLHLIDIIQVSQRHWTSLACEMSHNLHQTI